MNKKNLSAILSGWALLTLACGLVGPNFNLTSNQTDAQTATTTPLPTATELPVVEDIEKLQQETSTPTPTATPTPAPTNTPVFDVIQPGDGPNLTNPDPDDDESGNSNQSDTGNDGVALDVASATPPPTIAPSPTLSPTVAVAIAGDWPILPDATQIRTESGVVAYVTNTGVEAARDFYRREMTARGWSVINLEADVAGLEDVLYFEKGGVHAVVLISETNGQTGVVLGHE